MHKFRLVASITLLSLLVVAGCGDDKGTDSKDKPVPAELVANWTLTSGAVNGVPVPLSRLLAWESSTTHAVLVVSEHGTYTYYEKDADSAVVWQDSGAFQVDGSSFTLSGGQIPINGGQWEVSGIQLTLTISSDQYPGYTAVILATKPDTP